MDRKDSILTGFRSKEKSGFLKVRDNYTNESLEEFVTKKNDSSKLIEFKGEIIRRYEPIYMDPEYKFIKAHFYSPVKQVFGMRADTFIVNVLVLWAMTILLYLALYFRLLKKLLDSGEALMDKKHRKSS